jgi:polyphosphate kinase 2
MPGKPSAPRIVDLEQAPTTRPSYPYPKRMKRRKYQAELLVLQIEMLKLQAWVKERGERLVIVFEGRDGAGKGGTIKRLVEHLNPRGAHVIALEKPTEYERGQWYFQRYIKHLPGRGEIALFDRSWYNRAGVERVMGFCSDTEYRRFMHEAPQLESMWVQDGIRLFKFWLSIGHEEQQRRLLARSRDRLKRWKLTPIDMRAFDLWNEYSEARDAMLEATDTREAPWTVVLSEDKRRARVNVMRHLLHSVPYAGHDADAIPAPDPRIVGGPELIGAGD